MERVEFYRDCICKLLTAEVAKEKENPDIENYIIASSINPLSILQSQQSKLWLQDDRSLLQMFSVYQL